VTSRAKLLLAGGALAFALPALAQEVLLPPGFGNESTPAPTPAQPQTNTTAPAPTPSRPAARPRPQAPADEGGDVVEGELTEAELLALQPPPPVELPEESRRDPRVVGMIDPLAYGFGDQPWGSAHGGFLSQLMRRQSTPLPSRWLHMALRNALLARAPAPGLVNPADWTAERSWLLLRMGEADAARMLVAGTDVADYTPKLTQVAVQSALATADPAGLCPLRATLEDVEPKIVQLTQAMCAALEGEAANAASQIEQARRRGRVGGIDLVLADKVVGAGEDTGRATTVEWELVQQLTSWRFGMATATGVMPPDRLFNGASPRLRAWQARAPLLSAEERLPAARIATGLGVFSSGALVDIYSAIYDATDPSDLPGTDPWRVRTAFVGRTLDNRLDAMRQLWREGEGELQRQASRALLALAATRISPSPELQRDAPDLIASMLAGGFDREAAQWAAAVRQMDDEPADRAWAMLALGTSSSAIDVGIGRINSFIDRDNSRNKQRSKLLVAGLAGTGRISADVASRLNERHELGLQGASVWSRLTDRAGQRRQAGTAVLLAAIGMQAPSFEQVPAAQLYRGLTAMRLSGLDYAARMIAAEALART
jgi:hypothetical protein